MIRHRREIAAGVLIALILAAASVRGFKSVFSADPNPSMSQEVKMIPDGPSFCGLAGKGNLEDIRAAVEAGADPNSVDQRGTRAIVYALGAPDPVKVIKLLIELGAKTEYPASLDGNRSLKEAIESSRSYNPERGRKLQEIETALQLPEVTAGVPREASGIGWKSNPKSFKERISLIKSGDRLEELLKTLGQPDTKSGSTWTYQSSLMSGYLCICSFEIEDGLVAKVTDLGCAHVSVY